MTEQRVLFVEGVSEDRPADVPQDWMIRNASRPLPGHKEWVGDFRHGIFFSAVDPEADDAERLTERCKSLDGWLCVWRTRQDVEDYVHEMAKERGLDHGFFDFGDALDLYVARFNRGLA